MGKTIIGTFPTRREVEIAVEHLVQDYGLDRSDIFIEPVADQNSAGENVTGADAESGHPNTDTDAEGAAYNGALTVSVDVNDDEDEAVDKAFRDAGASNVTVR
ncbi:hypothetical protein C1T17_03850 [Sphingobium sp. SCG-1]|uniref:hypothetical protein n=1 Tax=Sphingobium sp. SCG-1 TaxID=2072936 RepID=UPI000CD69EA2|nr:hypothetical protein [Sphingobium sp. SCG-1]AUW57358.1 hypothetical protein C1T17_03850 [Sphingobium sp. SCG-1]